jgi:hypothetical protein
MVLKFPEGLRKRLGDEDDNRDAMAPFSRLAE